MLPYPNDYLSSTRSPRTYYALLLPLLITPLFYLAGVWGLNYFCGMLLTWSTVIKDGLLVLAFSYLLLGISRNYRGFFLLQFLLMCVLFAVNGLKIIVFGGPLTPDDAYAASAALSILVGWHFWLACVLLAIALCILLYSIRLTTRYALLSIGLFVATFGLIKYYASPLLNTMDYQFGHVVWSPRLNFQQRGPLVHMVQESLRFFVEQTPPPSLQQVQVAQKALHELQPTHPINTAFPPAPRRNVHIILLESFWDPTLLQGVQFNRDPLAGGLRELWIESESSTLLSPVFGGYTANAEFEILCGFPVAEDSVKFERRFNKAAPCLPEVLKKAGYQTVASHPNVASFWNRINVYPRMGFEKRWFLNDYIAEDMAKNEFMGDRTYYQQTQHKLKQLTDNTRPLLNYMVTIFGHLPYPLTEDRPVMITATHTTDTVAAYANNIYYKSIELMAYLKQLRDEDPDALIILFGDHLPNLGANFSGYTQAHFLADKRHEFDAEMTRRFTETPLIVINGRQGVLNTKTMAMYQLPHAILNWLSLPSNEFLSVSRNPDHLIIRPLPGQYLLLDTLSQQASLCRLDTPCPSTDPWLKHVETIMQDVFEGQQYFLKPLPPK